MDTTQLIVRRIRASDRAQVLEISSKIWGGHDYLPYVLDEWLTNPKCYTYGIEVDNRIVAIGNLRLVDRRKTGWMEGLRVHPDYRKRGYAGILTQHFVEMGKTLKVQRLRYSTGGNNRISLRLAKKAGFIKLFKMDALWYDLKTIQKSTHNSKKITAATPTEIHELSKTNQNLIPHNIIVYDWKAVNATLQNLRQVGKDRSFWISKRKGRLTGLSYGHKRAESEGDSWTFTVYASDEDSFQTHFCYQIKTAKCFRLSLAICTSLTQFENTLKENEKLPRFGWKLQLILLEKQIEQKNEQYHASQKILSSQQH